MKPMPERVRPVYTMNEPAFVPADQVMAAVTAPAVRLGDLEALLTVASDRSGADTSTPPGAHRD